MMHHMLLPHPASPPLAVRGVEVDLRRTDHDGMLLTYRIAGAGAVVLPPRRTPARADGLWRATCFELFLMFDDGERYVEFNFSPSTCWAAYAFDGYREGMAPLARTVPPAIARRENGVDVDLDLGGLPHGDLAMGLSAVIEEEGGRRSLWALAHPPGMADFHHRACFAARLAAAGVP